MAKTRTRKPPKPSANGTTEIELPVSFGNLNIGDKTARLGVVVPRTALTITKADNVLCGHRLTCVLVGRAAGAQSEQESLPGVEDDLETTVVADVKTFGVAGKTIAFGLTVSLPDVDLKTLTQFPKRHGLLRVTSVSDIPEESAADEGGEDDDE